MHASINSGLTESKLPIWLLPQGFRWRRTRKRSTTYRFYNVTDCQMDNFLKFCIFRCNEKLSKYPGRHLILNIYQDRSYNAVASSLICHDLFTYRRSLSPKHLAAFFKVRHARRNKTRMVFTRKQTKKGQTISVEVSRRFHPRSA